MSIRIFVYDGMVVNVDNNADAERMLKDPLTEREVPADDFGEDAKYVGPDTAVLNEDGTISFTKPDTSQSDILTEIHRLEGSITSRNIRSALLGDSWSLGKIQDVEGQISSLRSQLN